jgi:ubiquinone biosynthesis monooxygenase Coq7
MASASLSAPEARLSTALMRVNHAGEVAAQALYRGQALVTREAALREVLHGAARGEQDHLAWCRQRVQELGGRTSLLGPAWYAGSFLIGVLAGLAGPKRGLGFVAETERQVERHLSDHLGRLPPGDEQSRKIVSQIRADEIEHGAEALSLGGTPLPAPVRFGMGLAARVMTTLAHRL